MFKKYIVLIVENMFYPFTVKKLKKRNKNNIVQPYRTILL